MSTIIKNNSKPLKGLTIVGKLSSKELLERSYGRKIKTNALASKLAKALA